MEMNATLEEQFLNKILQTKFIKEVDKMNSNRKNVCKNIKCDQKINHLHKLKKKKEEELN